MASNYGEDDFVAFLAYAGPPAQPADRDTRLDQIELAEKFCESWFNGKPIDGQWAGFYTAYKNWFRRKEWSRQINNLMK